jgi:transposase
MVPKFVAPYCISGKRGKSDAADAAAICEALKRPSMRFVPVRINRRTAGIATTNGPQWRVDFQLLRHVLDV